MKKDENIISQELIDYCERAIEESKKLCDVILDNYKVEGFVVSPRKVTFSEHIFQ